MLRIYRTFYGKLALILGLLVQHSPQTREQPSCITGSSNPVQHFSYSHFFWCFVLVLILGNIPLLLPAKSNLAICAQLLNPTAGACLAGDFFPDTPLTAPPSPKAAPYLYFCSTSGRGFYFQTLPLPTPPPPKAAPYLYSSS